MQTCNPLIVLSKCSTHLPCLHPFLSIKVFRCFPLNTSHSCPAPSHPCPFCSIFALHYHDGRFDSWVECFGLKIDQSNCPQAFVLLSYFDILLLGDICQSHAGFQSESSSLSQGTTPHTIKPNHYTVSWNGVLLFRPGQQWLPLGGLSTQGRGCGRNPKPLSFTMDGPCPRIVAPLAY